MPWSLFFECWVLSQLFHSPLSLSSRGSSDPSLALGEWAHHRGYLGHEDLFLYSSSVYSRASLVTQKVKRLPAMRETWVRFLGQEDLLEKEMAIHSSTLAWKIPWTEEPDRPQSMGLQRVGHDWATSLLCIPAIFSWYLLLLLGPYHFCLYCVHLCMKCSLGISNFLEEISSLSRSIVFLYFFALLAEEHFLISPCFFFGTPIQVWPKSNPLWLYSGSEK